MRIIINDGFGNGNNKVLDTDILPRIGDYLCLDSNMTPPVNQVILYPDEKLLKWLLPTEKQLILENIDALVILKQF
ncbi:MAG: hypothetical protein WC119_00915 [Synergistaceae bacterium]